MSNDESVRTITRGELYELVWSKPLTDLAKQLDTTVSEISRLCDQVFRILRQGVQTR